MKLQRTALLISLPLILLTGGGLALAQSQIRNGTLAQSTPVETPSNMPQASPDGREPGGRGPGARLLEELDLTTEQAQRIQAIEEQAKTNSEALHEQMHQADDALRSQLASDASASELRQQHQQVQALRQQLDDQRFETMLQIREVLTAEQRTQLADLMQKHRGNHRGPGGPGGPGEPDGSGDSDSSAMPNNGMPQASAQS